MELCKKSGWSPVKENPAVSDTAIPDVTLTGPSLQEAREFTVQPSGLPRSLSWARVGGTARTVCLSAVWPCPGGAEAGWPDYTAVQAAAECSFTGFRGGAARDSSRPQGAKKGSACTWLISITPVDRKYTNVDRLKRLSKPVAER